MRRALSGLALAVCLLGSDPTPLASAEPVSLLTGGSGACWAGGGPTVEGPLLADPKYGTAIKQEFHTEQPSDGSIVPVMWPTGFTGLRLAGGEVAVVGYAGKVVATTGGNYWLEAGPVHHSRESRRMHKRLEAFPACGHVIAK